MKLTKKEEAVKKIEEYLIDNKVDLVKHASIVHARGIKQDISSDLIFAKLDETKEEPIIELAEQAYFGRRMCDKIIKNATTYTWNNTKKVWIKKDLPNWKRQKIERLNEGMFDAYMVGPSMLAVLKRNKPRNPILKLTAGFDEESLQQQEDEQYKEIIDQIDKKVQEKKQKK